MHRKQIVTKRSLGLMGLILPIPAGHDRTGSVNPNLVRANTIFAFKMFQRLTTA